MELASGHIGRDTLLILDLSDIRKKYADKMEYLTVVRDGSENELGNGYSIFEVVAAEIDGGPA